MRSIVQNRYSEEFKKNTVAVIRAGLPLRVTANKLTVPVNTIAYWLAQDKFKDIGPAPEPVIKAVFEQNKLETCIQKPMLVQVTKKEEHKETSDKSLVKVNYGKLSIEFSNGLTVENLRTIIQALGGKDVL